MKALTRAEYAAKADQGNTLSRPFGKRSRAYKLKSRRRKAK